jgi:iron(III) transport system ATP-binding protein
VAPRPGVLLMDEPFSGLDARLRDMMRNETLGVLRETRATSVIVTHDPEEALRMGDQIALLHEGRVEQIGTGRELYYKPKSLFAAGFFSELNIFDGKVSGGKLETPLGPVKAGPINDGEPVVVAVRVGAIAIGEPEIASAKTIGRILSVHFSGDHDHLQIGISGADEPIRARVPAGTLSVQQLAGGGDVSLAPEPRGTFVFSPGQVSNPTQI